MPKLKVENLLSNPTHVYTLGGIKVLERQGDVVEDDFAEGQAQAMERDERLKVTRLDGSEADDGETATVSLKRANLEELREAATARSIEFDDTWTKKQLFEAIQAFEEAKAE